MLLRRQRTRDPLLAPSAQGAAGLLTWDLEPGDHQPDCLPCPHSRGHAWDAVALQPGSSDDNSLFSLHVHGVGV